VKVKESDLKKERKEAPEIVELAARPRQRSDFEPQMDIEQIKNGQSHLRPESACCHNQ
jgi:hypothetical protein